MRNFIKKIDKLYCDLCIDVHFKVITFLHFYILKMN